MRTRHRRGVVAAVAVAALAFAGLPLTAGAASGVPSCQHAFPGGDGSTATPFHVASAADLQAIDTCLDKAFIQTTDISLSGSEWVPLGSGKNAGAGFIGVYDGNGKTISGLTITQETEDVGLFSGMGTGDISTPMAEIKNLTLTGVNIAVSGQNVYNIGTLVGIVYGQSAVNGVRAVGPVGGNGVSVTAAGTARSVGGLLGAAFGPATIHRSSTDVGVSVVAQVAAYGVGGLVGLLDAHAGSAVVSESRATGAVRSDQSAGSTWTGGLVGRSGRLLDVDGSDNTARVVNSYATGAVAGKAYVGGLVGLQYVTYFADSAPVTATTVNSFATGAVSGDAALGVSGLVGPLPSLQSTESLGTVTSGYWDTQTSGQAAATCATAAECGEGKTTEQMQTQATFVGWSFSTVKSDSAIWGICQLGVRTYPFLWAFTATDPCPTVPGAPQNPAATAGDGQAVVTWSPPASDGGTPVTGYTVALATPAAGSPTCTTTGALTCTLTGLTNGTTYTLLVTATNAVGTGPASTAFTVTPVAPTPPTPPTPPTVRQRPVRPLGLPSQVKNTGWTSLLDVPVVTNAGQEARVRVTCTPRVRGLAPAGDVVWCTVVRKAGKVRVWLSGTRGAVVRVVVSAPAVEGYTAYRKVTVYRTTRVR